MSRTCPECQSQYDDAILHCPEDGLDLSSVEPDDELIGRTIGSYRVVKVLGKGGMGAVYMAEHPVIGSRVAIKFLHSQYSTDKKIVDRFFNEARAVNVIGHDNILKILDLNVTDDNVHYFIMEFLHGKALQDLVLPDRPMPFDAAGPILLQVCEALQAAHDHGIIHRDLKPDNVYLIVHKGKKNFVKVVDFGIAKLTDESGQSTGKTQTGMVMGTPAYMSPEQAGGMTQRIDGRSDIYSLGVMMFQMATGKLPFPGTSFGEVLIGHLQIAPPKPRALTPEIPAAFEAVILKCLEKKQEDRYQSMAELHDAIAAVMEELGITRELPVASEQEIAAAQGTRTRSTPPTQQGMRKTPRPPTRPKLTPAPPNRTGAQTRYLPPPAAPQRSNAGLVVGIGAAALVVVGGGVGFVLYQQAEARREEKAQLVLREAEKARKVAEQLERERAERAAAKVVLAVASEPMGSSFEATWEGGATTGITPFNFEVPKGTKVHLAFSKKDHLAFETDVVADTARVVRAALLPERPVAAAGTVPEVKPKAKPRPKPAETNDSTIPLEF